MFGIERTVNLFSLIKTNLPSVLSQNLLRATKAMLLESSYEAYRT